MNKDRLDAIWARIGFHAEAVRALVRRAHQAWGNAQTYRPGDHYMRGPGPKWREKHGQDRAAKELVQQPMILSDKWDF